jgi:hypothetical protein
MRKATQPHSIRVRLGSNCIELKQRTISKISVRGCLRCGRSATDSCELCESCDILTVMADPSEGEALTDAGNDLVVTVPMPAAIIETIDSFFAEHIVERPFTKRQRDRCESQIAGHHG